MSHFQLRKREHRHDSIPNGGNDITQSILQGVVRALGGDLHQVGDRHRALLVRLLRDGGRHEGNELVEILVETHEI